MRILVTGATGLIGRHLIALLAKDHTVTALGRDNKKTSRVLAQLVDLCLTLEELETLDGFDAIINLAGEPIAEHRWSQKQKQRICESRWHLTEGLLEKLRHCTNPPQIWLNASAVGSYGSQGSQRLTEECSRMTDDFPHQVCVRWEELAKEAADYGCRVCIMRIGPVLTTEGGMLGKQLPLFRLGLGGVQGDGEQYISWISMDDLLLAIQFLLTEQSCHGIYNLTAPHPVPQKEFARQLAITLDRPLLLPLPALLLRLVLGEMSTMLLDGQNIYPSRLLESGFHFKYPELIPALRHLFHNGHTIRRLPDA